MSEVYLILSFCPKRSVERMEILFLFAMVAMGTPYFPEMEDSVSPERTLCSTDLLWDTLASPDSNSLLVDLPRR